jgi:hypothetical protein
MLDLSTAAAERDKGAPGLMVAITPSGSSASDVAVTLQVVKPKAKKKP